MASKAQPGYVMPVDVRRVKSHVPCESCGLRRVYYKARFSPPGRGRVTLRLCDNCIEAIRL